jgi:hypothetical protein
MARAKIQEREAARKPERVARIDRGTARSAQHTAMPSGAVAAWASNALTTPRGRHSRRRQAHAERVVILLIPPASGPRWPDMPQ